MAGLRCQLVVVSRCSGVWAVPLLSAARAAAVVGDASGMAAIRAVPSLLLESVIQAFRELTKSPGGFPKMVIFFLKALHRLDAGGQQ